MRDWLFVNDHCEAIDSILQKAAPGEHYNIGGQNEIDNISLVNMICKLMDKIKPSAAPHARLISFVQDRPGHDLRYAIDNAKIENALGWTPSAEFEKNLEATIRFYIT